MLHQRDPIHRSCRALKTGALLVSLITPVSVLADSALPETLAGAGHIELRLRGEQVISDAAQNAQAITLRTRLNYATTAWHGLGSLVEFDAVRLMQDDFAPKQTGYAVIADMPYTAINQAYLSYQGVEGLVLQAGRQRILLDNQRFVGNVGWRQNEQTYDAASMKWTWQSLKLQYAFVDHVQSISETTVDTSHHLVNLGYTVNPQLALSGYAYLLDHDDQADESLDTFGVRATGSVPASQFKIGYAAEWATQETEDQSKARYALLETTLTHDNHFIGLGYELLGSDDGQYGFSTPLATKHAFNGWADLFLTTPASGLRNAYLKLGGSIGAVKLLGVYHDFRSDESSSRFGREADLMATWDVKKNVSVGIKLASFEAKAHGADTTKTWLWTDIKI